MYYEIDGDRFESAREAAEHITENLDEDIYDEMLDECYEEVDICGYKYSPSVALYRIDPIAYRCGMTDYYDSLASDIKYDVDRMDDGEEQDIYGFTVIAHEEEEEE